MKNDFDRIFGDKKQVIASSGYAVTAHPPYSEAQGIDKKIDFQRSSVVTRIK